MAIPRPFVQIPDDLKPEEIGPVLRTIHNAAMTAIGDLETRILKDPRFTDERVANALRGMEGNVVLDTARMPSPGDVLYAVDGGRRAVWGSAATAAPTGGGTGPATGASHILLDGLYITDSVNSAVLRGALVVGNATPKWGRLAVGAANTSLVSNGTDPSWGTPVQAAGWQDVANVISEITTTDKVVIGASAALSGTRFSLVNAGATTDVILGIKAVASQSGDMLRMLNSSGRVLARFDQNGDLYFGNTTDVTVPANIVMGSSLASVQTLGPNKAVLTWLDNFNAISPPTSTADMQGCAGARVYTYKDPAGQYDFVYGQDNPEGWVAWGDDTIAYAFYNMLSGTSSLVVRWSGNGDMEQRGIVNIKKNAKAAGSVAASTPALRLWSTGSSSPTRYVGISAPGTVGTTYTLTLPTAAPATTGITRVDSSGNVTFDTTPVISSTVAAANVNLTAQAAAITSTNLVASPAVGLYRVSYAISWTTADGASTGTVQMQVGHTDDIGATTQTGSVIAATTQTRDRGSFVCYVASGALTYQTNVTGTIGATAKYALRVRVEYLG